MATITVLSRISRKDGHCYGASDTGVELYDGGKSRTCMKKRSNGGGFRFSRVIAGMRGSELKILEKEGEQRRNQPRL